MSVPFIAYCKEYVLFITVSLNYAITEIYSIVSLCCDIFFLNLSLDKLIYILSVLSMGSVFRLVLKLTIKQWHASKFEVYQLK